jgi:hypothetical protein
MDVITTAIIAALAALSKDAIADSYNALKSALKNKSAKKIVKCVMEFKSRSSDRLTY